MPVNVDLNSTPTTTINESNVGDGNIDLTLGTNGTLIFDGVNATIADTIGGNIVSNTTYEAIDGAHVTVESNVSGVNVGSSVTYDIGANSSITQDVGTLNVSLLSGSTINFENTGGTGSFALSPSAINLSLSNIPAVNGLSTGDKIEVIGASSATLSGDVLTFTYPGLLGLPEQTSFLLNNIPVGSSISFDSATGTAVFACFLRGTMVWTPHGEVAVEDLSPGDEILSLKLGITTIKWIGRRTLDPLMIENPKAAFPICVKAHAFGQDTPRRDLFLSPDHSLLFEGHLVPAKLLLNGTTITQITPTEPFEYFHIELDEHDVIAVEGILAETYLDLGNRHMFGGPGVVQFFTGQKKDWRDYAYPPLYEGPALDRLRRVLAARAEEFLGGDGLCSQTYRMQTVEMMAASLNLS
jgi:hypothetical protein